MITLDEAKLHCRIDADMTDEDAAITDMIATAKAHVENYVGTTYTDDAPAPVKSAALILITDLYENRTLQTEVAFYTNRTFAQLLNPYRAMEV